MYQVLKKGFFDCNETKYYNHDDNDDGEQDFSRKQDENFPAMKSWNGELPLRFCHENEVI